MLTRESSLDDINHASGEDLLQALLTDDGIGAHGKEIALQQVLNRSFACPRQAGDCHNCGECLDDVRTTNNPENI